MKSMMAAVMAMGFTATAGADPQLTSWFTLDSGKYAEIYRTEADEEAGQTQTTWSNGRQMQLSPAYSGVQEILSSSNWIYIRSTGLGSHVMGPWYMDPQHYRQFPNLPTDQHLIFAMTRHPVVQTTHGFNHMGEIGLSVDGVRMFDANDAF